MTDDLQTLLDERNLLGLVNRYARGLDRCDVDQLKAVFFEDSTVNMISFCGNAFDFAEATLAALRTNAATTTHLTSNCIFEISGDRAIGESYLLSMSVMKGENVAKPAVHVGRYLDKFERRDGNWKIANRAIVIDLELSGSFPPALEAIMPTGNERRHPDDELYAMAAWLKG